MRNFLGEQVDGPEGHLEKKFGANGATGAAGENFYAAAIGRDRRHDGYAVYRSLKIPKTNSEVDVDFAVASGNKLLLIDVKKWASAEGVMWTLPLANKPMQNLGTYQLDARWKRLSKNMEMAVERYSEALSGVSVSAMVVFVPAQKNRMPKSVDFLIFPGRIRSYLSGHSFGEMRSRLGASAEPRPATTELLTRMKMGS